MVDHTSIDDIQEKSVVYKMIRTTKSKFLINLLIILFGFSIMSAAHGQTDLERDIQDERNIQELETITIQSCNCVAFRLDDIQGYWLNNAQIAVIEEFHINKIPLTIGIIGGEKFQFGNDPKITDYVQNKIIGNAAIRIANHGWSHENFSTFDKDSQSELLKKSNERISKILGVTPNVFIPPFNEYDENTVSALLENEFTHLSPSLITSNPPYLSDDSDLHKYPTTATTGEIGKVGLFEGMHHKETMKDIQIGVNNFGFAVVMMHPQEFSMIKNKEYTNVVNNNQIQELKLLIDDIEDAGLKIVFLEEIEEHIESYEIMRPKWFQTVVHWHDEEKISNAEFLDLINYLKIQEVIKISKY